ncbi:aminotransferase class V-fold PLP-dependent enzyme [Dactylosporangium sp. NBC_01737]|uniref:pyridoxal phosphate-dependent decarboxylase family protein n=1 Tax=Dactylosporangium sp. NBC_01737 TaxID=2975959 RepID=UPI002E131C0B|nr:aminotransferase class V-fold PLP-dependent enzyme [Dactylosporangium sp. NBC_01737]
MDKPDWQGPLTEAYEQATRFLTGLPDRPVGSRATLEQLRASLGGPLPAKGVGAREVVARLAEAADPGVVASPSGRFFGFVIGGAMPAALAADWLTATWDQNAGLYAAGPAAAVVEEVAGEWLRELFGLPATVSVGFVTGAQMSHVTALAAARHEVLRRVGWDVETGGLHGAPRISVLAGADRHSTIDRALRFLGIGTAALVPVMVDAEGRMVTAALRDALDGLDGPAIVCAQLGNVNTGACDPIGEICDAAHAAGAWVHVDGAFGLWAAASERHRHLVAGVERADSWTTDAHKWLNVPYDSGLVFCAHPSAHRAAMGIRAAYLVHAGGDERDALEHNPEFSRRARGFAVYAALRSLGRDGVEALIDRSCALAARFAARMAGHVLNDVVLNQVLVGFGPDTADIVRQVQAEGTCWVSGTTWHDKPAMRFSVSNFSTDESDIDRSVDTILRLAGR